MSWWQQPKVNKVIMTMIYADFLLISATGFLAPIYAVFVTKQVAGASLATVGFVTTLFWVVKSAMQLPVSSYIDSVKGERDDFRVMVTGAVIASAVPLLYYLFVRETWQMFAVETLNGIGYAMLVPTWLAIYTRHIDRHREGWEWMLHSNAVGLGFAITSSVGGVLAERFGFSIIFLLTSAFSFVGAALLTLIGKDMDGTAPRSGSSTAFVIAAEKEKLP